MRPPPAAPLQHQAIEKTVVDSGSGSVNGFVSCEFLERVDSVSALKRTLKSLCCSNGWSYAVFWGFDQRNAMIILMDREMLVQTRKSINIIFNYFGLGGVGKNESKRAPKHAPTRPQRRKSQTITLDNLRSSIRDMTLELQKFLGDDTWKETRKEVGNEKRPSRRMPASMFDIHTI
ncbi:hypothetical protein Q3G72_016666 [Acer saccharum]|nr:hypothetical protein Q3G72_016666 [Acer saccharum]